MSEIQDVENNIKTIFSNYTSDKQLMENASFVKLFRDSGLLGKQFSSVDLDIIFSKNKTKGQRKINLQQFKDALRDCASKKKMDLDDFTSKLNLKQPIYSGTKANKVELHDNKSLYTGVYGKGGPSTIDLENGDLSNLTNRKKADVRGVNIQEISQSAKK